ncbi:MAG: hypothetical protein R3F59_12875 [Myxococcota bacterium]
MEITRRGLLGGAGALAVCGVPDLARAAPLTARTVPGAGAYNVLEICFVGGLAHRESLWVESPSEAPARSGALGARSGPGPRADRGRAPGLAAPASRTDFRGPDFHLGSAAGRDVHSRPGLRPVAWRSGLRERLGRRHGPQLPSTRSSWALAAQADPAPPTRTRAGLAPP